MPNSRVAAGFFMIAASVFLFLLAGITDDPELEIGIEWGVFIQTFVFITAVMLIGFGIYFAFLGKFCAECGEKLTGAATHRHHHGHNFDSAPGRISRSHFAKDTK